MNRFLVAVQWAAVSAFLGAAAPSFGADAGAGKLLFQQRCTVCHTAEPNDNGGAQGPSLLGVFERPAATGAGFSYSQALRAANLRWDAATLDRFLASPTTVVPGSSMLLAVPEAADRANLIAYFKSVAGAKAPAVSAAMNAPNASRESADWRSDAPGRVHRIQVAALPPPFATGSSGNSPHLASRPATAAIAVPAGFHVEVFANGFAGPRKMTVAANGDILLTETVGGRVTILHPTADGTHAAGMDVYAQGLKQPFGVALFPNAGAPQWLYVAETHRVIRYAFRTGDLKPRGAPEVVVPELPHGVGHFTRDIAFSPDGKQLFVSVGSGSNVAETMSKRTPQEVKSWETKHGLGAAWDIEANRAAVLVFDMPSPAAGTIYATGIRNCVSLTIQPQSGALWCTTNERDLLGDDLVPDYSTRVKRGGFYGWPWYYIGSHEDPRMKGERPDLASHVLVPDVLYQAHSAALSMTFYTANTGKSAFPPDYVGDALVGFHGSWNRSLRTGYKLVRVHMKNGDPTGDYEDFLTGFVVDDTSVWGRPVATVQLKDGSLLMSEDGGNTLYRISYAP